MFGHLYTDKKQAILCSETHQFSFFKKKSVNLDKKGSQAFLHFIRSMVSCLTGKRKNKQTANWKVYDKGELKVIWTCPCGIIRTESVC